MKHPKAFKPAGRSCYYFNYNDGDGKRRRRSTGCTTRENADDEIRQFMTGLTGPGRSGATFAAYSAPFYVWETCPHVSRLRDAGKSIGKLHVETSRRWLDMWVLTDSEFCELPIREITRGDILDLRRRLRARVIVESKRRRGEGLATVNKVIAAVKTVFFEAYFREDIAANPADGVGDVTYEHGGPDIFSLDELRGMFARDSLACRVFKTAAWTGMRCSEVLAMHCDQLQGDVLPVDHAWKHHKQDINGVPKWGKVRQIMLAREIREDLTRWAAGRTGLLFCYPGGARLRAGWWRENFKAILKYAGVEAAGRHLTPHSLRHSLNTHLLEAGVDPLRIQVYLWGTRVDDPRAPVSGGITKIQNIYTHFQASMTEPVARAIERLLGVARAVTQAVDSAG